MVRKDKVVVLEKPAVFRLGFLVQFFRIGGAGGICFSSSSLTGRYAGADG